LTEKHCSAAVITIGRLGSTQAACKQQNADWEARRSLTSDE